MIEGEALNYLHHDFVRAPSILSVDQGMPPAAAGFKLSDRALQMGLILGRLERIGINVKRYAALANHFFPEHPDDGRNVAAQFFADGLEVLFEVVG